MEPRPPQPEREPERSPEAADPVAPQAVQRALALLRPVPAPTELDQRLALECGTQAPVAQWLRELPQAKAPAVLDRLVLEELADPDRSIAERFTGDLPAAAAPRSLRRRLTVALSAEDARNSRARWGLVGSGLAAAALALVVFWPQESASSQGPTEGDIRARLRLKRVDVASAAELGPMGLLLADSLAGGIDLSTALPASDVKETGGTH